jgi:multiple antibiotic resistance protein
VMLMMAKSDGLQTSLVVLAALGANLLLLLLALLLVEPIMRFAGKDVEAVITRVLGVILAALAVQFVLDGLRGTIF